MCISVGNRQNEPRLLFRLGSRDPTLAVKLSWYFLNLPIENSRALGARIKYGVPKLLTAWWSTLNRMSVPHINYTIHRRTLELRAVSAPALVFRCPLPILEDFIS
jgi:hypothetical protein